MNKIMVLVEEQFFQLTSTDELAPVVELKKNKLSSVGTHVRTTTRDGYTLS